MIETKWNVAGQVLTIRTPEDYGELDGFNDFIEQNHRGLGLDTETTGLDIYSKGFGLRTVQFGSATEAWVIPVEKFGTDIVRSALGWVSQFALHNASFDLQVLDKTLGVPMESLWPKVVDTRILSHLVDPRAREEGGPGNSLEDLTRFYVDEGVADGVKGSMRELAKEAKCLKSEIFRKVDLFNPDYLLYAGMDAILAARLYGKLKPLVPGVSQKLVGMEHKLAEVCSYLDRTGFLLDVEYAQNLSSELEGKEAVATWLAAEYGCLNVNSPEQVAKVLLDAGVKIKERTPTGKPKVDNVLLDRLVSEGDPFAKLVVEAKKARKWRKTWVDGFLAHRDEEDRCHASINPLRARTARMSITGIPAQTLPSGDSTIRRCFIADPGQLICSVDYQAQELRVLAALSRDRTMIQAFRKNADLHQITADAAGVERSIGKMANFVTVYGGGAGTLAKQAKVDLSVAKDTLAAFRRTYPGVGRYSKEVMHEAFLNGYVITPTGRRLPVDPFRPYSALNYVIQSTSRDITARALIRLHEAGFTPYLRLPIHDEILASVPAEAAQWGADKIGDIMEEKMGPVMITTGPQVYGRSWGDGYSE